jgi:hypothetical protein
VSRIALPWVSEPFRMFSTAQNTMLQVTEGTLICCTAEMTLIGIGILDLLTTMSVMDKYMYEVGLCCDHDRRDLT